MHSTLVDGPGVQQRKGPMPTMRHHEARAIPVRGRRAGLLGAALLLAACGPDPKGKFEEFLEDTRESEATGATGTMGGSETTAEPTTGPTSESTTMGDTGAEPLDISGDFLLAVSTIVDRSKPLQFVATNTMTVTGDKTTLSVCLQPLTLDQGKVTIPREPIGEPLCFMDIPVVGNAFTIDAGTVMVTGAANPITGADIVASLVMAGEIQEVDFYCGSVTGDVMTPMLGSIAGSTFAAVRLTDKTVLPTDVTINCDRMPTVTDPP